jgi:Protein of unknown function (DUF2786)
MEPAQQEDTMNIERSKILDKIRALFAKTVEAGCSEAEALSALAKARAMMDAYEVTEDDLALTKEEKAVLQAGDRGNDLHGIQFALVNAICEFTDTQGWRSGRVRGDDANGYQFTFCGLKSDVDLAHYLLGALTPFVQDELVNHLAASLAPRDMRRRTINDFVLGITSRISERMHEIVEQSKAQQTSNSRALVVVKSGIVKAAMKANDIRLRVCCGGDRVGGDPRAFAAGRAAGDRASFGRPVTGSTKALLAG